MAFDVVGINPSSPYSKCLRFNIWKWNDLRLVLRKFYFFNEVDEYGFMSNDGYVINGLALENLIRILNHVKIISELEPHNENWLLDKIYQSSENLDMVAYHDDFPEFDSGKLSHSDVKIFLLFLSGCDGFKIM